MEDESAVRRYSPVTFAGTSNPMPTETDPWLRPYYQPGGGTPFLFYVVYGSIDHSAQLPGARYRVGAAPADLQIVAYDSRQREYVQSFREEAIPTGSGCTFRPQDRGVGG